MIVENNKYFVDQVNSSKANKMTQLYHYSGVGFKKALLNLGVFRKEDNKLVGVLQFGCSFQENIRLDRYVKEAISKDEYLELNRFCMADSEGKNSESQAISLGIKWIKRNLPNIRLLVSYAGRKEGNYGYIYQATNWEYLGYFISQGFWFVDGEERHLATLWFRYKKQANQDLPFTEGLCDLYQDIRKTWTKQFIYIIRLDKKLTPASEVLPYPKPVTDYPIKVKEIIIKQNDEVFNNFINKKPEYVEYFYTPNEELFSKQTLRRRAGLVSTQQKLIGVYDAGGTLEKVIKQATDYISEKYLAGGIRKSIRDKTIYKDKYFRAYYDEEPEDEIEVPYICIIDEIPFATFAEVGRYLGVSRQAVHQARLRQSPQIKESDVTWI